jgi:tRNA (guanine-N(7)-)-methyltransferase subunit TRM82
MTGQEKGDLPVAEAIEPFIVIKKVLGRHQGADGEDNEGAAAAEGGPSKGKKGKGKKGKGQAQRQKTKQPAEGEEDTSMAVDGSGLAESAAAANEDASISSPVPQKILAIRRIETLTAENAPTIILFSAIGYEALSLPILCTVGSNLIFHRSTALFSAPYPSSSSSASLPSLPLPELQHIDFTKPVIDFVVLPSTSSSSYPFVFVTLDSFWGDNDQSTPEASPRVRLVTVSSSGKVSFLSSLSRSYSWLSHCTNYSYHQAHRS